MNIDSKKQLAHGVLPCDFEWVKDDSFLIDHSGFNEWAEGRKSFRMEYFYREVRRKYQLLLQSDGTPEGDRWNFDAENREGWRGKAVVPEPPVLEPDTITEEVVDLVQSTFSDNPGRLEHFQFATDSAGGREAIWMVSRVLSTVIRALSGRIGRGVAVVVPRPHLHVLEYRST